MPQSSDDMAANPSTALKLFINATGKGEEMVDETAFEEMDQQDFDDCAEHLKASFDDLAPCAECGYTWCNRCEEASNQDN